MTRHVAADPAARGNHAAASGGDARPLVRWLPIVNGAVAVALGAVLVFATGETLTFVATFVGIAIFLTGAIELLSIATRPGLERNARLAGTGVALLALAAGIVVIVHPEGSVKTVAVVAGIFLVLAGLASFWRALTGRTPMVDLARGSLAVLIGGALIVWPGIGVGTVALLYGVLLLIRGVAELVAGIWLIGEPES